MTIANGRSHRLGALLAERTLLLDGGMGTILQEYRLGEAEYRGTRFADWPRDLKGNNDLLVLTQPEIVGDVYNTFLEAGFDSLNDKHRQCEYHLRGRLRQDAPCVRTERC